MNWTEILERGGVPEPPGYQETVKRVLERPRQKPFKPSRRQKAKRKRKSKAA
jgi:hypothetical protein